MHTPQHFLWRVFNIEPHVRTKTPAPSGMPTADSLRLSRLGRPAEYLSGFVHVLDRLPCLKRPRFDGTSPARGRAHEPAWGRALASPGLQTRSDSLVGARCWCLVQPERFRQQIQVESERTWFKSFRGLGGKKKEEINIQTALFGPPQAQDVPLLTVEGDTQAEARGPVLHQLHLMQRIPKRSRVLALYGFTSRESQESRFSSIPTSQANEPGYFHTQTFLADVSTSRESTPQYPTALRRRLRHVYFVRMRTDDSDGDGKMNILWIVLYVMWVDLTRKSESRRIERVNLSLVGRGCVRVHMHVYVDGFPPFG